MAASNTTIPRILAFHDLAAFGRAAMSVVVPVLSALQSQVVAVPTALFSSHGMFPDAFRKDLDDEIVQMIRYFSAQKLGFDAIYSGFVPNQNQLKQISSFIENQVSNINSVVLIDPVLGDSGKFYSFFSTEMVKAFQQAIRFADIITPNYTEACLLAEVDYIENPNKFYLELIVKKIRNFTDSSIVITSVNNYHIKNNTPNLLVVFDNQSHNIVEHEHLYVSQTFPGTGDIFASVLLGLKLKGALLNQAVNQAAQFTSFLVEESIKQNYDYREGVLLEEFLYKLNDYA